jgi:penicillin-binding protein 1A
LLELTAAYAAIAANGYPVRPHGLTAPTEKSWLDALGNRSKALGGRIRDDMRDLLRTSITGGTGRQAALPIDAFGKTGTSQDNRDALFLGFAEDLVVGVWVGNDDNSSNPGLSGGGIPARIWRDFMQSALGLEAIADPAEDDSLSSDGENGADAMIDLGAIGDGGAGIDGNVSGFGLNLRFGRDGSIAIDRRPAQPRGDAAAVEDDPPDPPADEGQ